MSSQTEIAVRDGNFFVIDNEMEEPRTKGQQKLLAYMHEQITLGNKADKVEIRKIYINNAMTSRGEYRQVYSTEARWDYTTSAQCKALHPEYHVMATIWDTYAPCKWRDWEINDSEVIIRCDAWFNRSIGSLVKNGFLIVIPKGYVLQRIEESKKLENEG